GHAQLGRTLLKLHGVAAGSGGDVDQLLTVLELAVVVDSYLTDDVHGLAVADLAATELDKVRHGFGSVCFWRCSRIRSHSSRTAPRPPGRSSTSAAACLARGCASATATPQPTAARHSRSLTSLPTYTTWSSAMPCASHSARSAASFCSTACWH